MRHTSSTSVRSTKRSQRSQKQSRTQSRTQPKNHRSSYEARVWSQPGSQQAAVLPYERNNIRGVEKRYMDTVCLSTEEMVAEIDRVNTRDHGSGLFIGSTDFKALYPSLDIDFTVEKVCDVIRQSTIKFEGLWYEELGLYIFINIGHTYRTRQSRAGSGMS